MGWQQLLKLTYFHFWLCLHKAQSRELIKRAEIWMRVSSSSLWCLSLALGAPALCWQKSAKELIHSLCSLRSLCLPSLPDSLSIHCSFHSHHYCTGTTSTNTNWTRARIVSFFLLELRDRSEGPKKRQAADGGCLYQSNRCHPNRYFNDLALFVHWTVKVFSLANLWVWLTYGFDPSWDSLAELLLLPVEESNVLKKYHIVQVGFCCVWLKRTA